MKIVLPDIEQKHCTERCSEKHNLSAYGNAKSTQQLNNARDGSHFVVMFIDNEEPLIMVIKHFHL